MKNMFNKKKGQLYMLSNSVEDLPIRLTRTRQKAAHFLAEPLTI